MGDSYTIGEQVPLAESFPYQTVQLLRKRDVEIAAPEIIAKTGWTTGELLSAVSETKFLRKYNFVSLLIGVNNQYRGRNVEEYKVEFEYLLNQSIELAGNNPGHVFVLSIPDWGITPFADGKDKNVIAGEIDSFNEACKIITENNGCIFIENTTSHRKDHDTEMLAGDGLHPSGKEYAKWSEKLSAFIFAAHSL